MATNLIHICFSAFIVLTVCNVKVFGLVDHQAIDGFIENLEKTLPSENFDSAKTSDNLDSVNNEGTNNEENSQKESIFEKETAQLVGDENEFLVTELVRTKAADELKKINPDLLLINVTRVTGQATNDVIQTMYLVVAPKDCSEESCYYSCKLQYASSSTQPIENTCSVNDEKREKRGVETTIRKQVEPEEAENLAHIAASTLDMFDVDNNKRVVKQIINATKELSQGVMYSLVIRLSVVNCGEGDKDKVCDGPAHGPDSLCRVKLYRSFENNSSYKLIQSDCTPIDVVKKQLIKANGRTRRTTNDDYTPVDINSDVVKELVKLSIRWLAMRVNCGDCVFLEKILKAKKSVDNPPIYLLTLIVKEDNKREVCDVVILDKYKENNRSVKKIQCEDFNNVSIDALLGGYKDQDVHDPSIKKIADFVIGKIGESLNSLNAKYTQIISAQTQVVSGINYKLKLRVLDDNKASHICDVVVYDQSWTNTREVSKIECNPDKRKKRDALLGGYKDQDVDDPSIKKIADFSIGKIGESLNSANAKYTQIISAQTQVVSGINYKLKLRVLDDNKASHICDVIVYDQSWTNTREVSKIECNPDNRKKRDVLFGGYNN